MQDQQIRIGFWSKYNDVFNIKNYDANWPDFLYLLGQSCI